MMDHVTASQGVLVVSHYSMKGVGGFDHCLALQWVDWFA